MFSGNIPYPTVFDFIKKDTGPAMFFVSVMSISRFAKNVLNSNFANSSLEARFINTRSTILLFHLHHDRVVEHNAVAFDLGNLSFKMEIEVLWLPLQCSR